MGWKLSKTKAELKAFYAEIVIENGPRYRHIKEWPHLYIDVFNSFFGMHYTLAHIVGIMAPVLIFASMIF